MPLRRRIRSVMLALLGVGFIGHASGQYTHTVIPIGNVADIPSIRGFCGALNPLLEEIGGNQTLLFTGDIIRSAKGDYARLDSLLSFLPPHENRKLIFLPGDRDWDASGPDGWVAVRALEKHIRSIHRDDLIWPLHNGCPGPEKVDLDLTLQLIAVNTQWWNHPYEKPTPESATCEITNHEEAKEELEKLIDEARFGNILIAGHYPVISRGEYGGHFPVGQWLFPFPVVNTMITAHRQNVGTPLDIVNARYRVFREDMEDILSEYPSLLYVSGHDATREVIRFNENLLIQSGIPASDGFIDPGGTSAYSSSKAGLMIIQYDIEGNVWAGIYDAEDNAYVFTERVKLLQAPCRTPLRDVAMNQRLVPCLEDQYVLPQMTGTYPDTVVAVAGPQYEAGGLRTLFLGRHYRDTWTTPVHTKYLDLDHEDDGLIPYLKGGGRQTRSLRMRGEDGREYVFRSVDKDPSKALAYSLRETLISLIVRDQTTTQHPYGALVASRLLDETGILHARPELFVMPDDGKLGPFQESFRNMLGLLEERPSGRKAVQKTFADADEIASSTELFRDLYRDNTNTVDAHEFIQARVFDLLTGDWGKHEDNWKWAGFDMEEGTIFRPVPRDRDHVFSRWDGILPWLVDREWAKPSGENFGYRIQGLRSLMWQARHLDRLVANEMSKEDWCAAAVEVQHEITPAEIDSAIATLPEDVQAIDAPEISEKLKARLQDLPAYAAEYYAMLAKSVDVRGSNKSEYFVAHRLPDGQVSVGVYSDSLHTHPVYARTFAPDETKEVRLYGMQGDDTFTITGDSKKSVLIRVVPGPGENTITDSSSVAHGRKSTRVYLFNKNNAVQAGSETKLVQIPNETAYQYYRTRFAYPTYLPLIYLYASSGNGISFGGGVMFTRQSYDKPDYSAIHRIMGRTSTLGNFRFEYEGKVRHVVGTWDLSYGALLDKHYRFNYFFGTGNNTTIDPERINTDYYTLRFSSLQISGGLSRTFWERSSVEGIFTLLGSGKENEANNIFEPGVFPDVSGNDRLRIAKVHVALDIDFRDRIHLPQRGMRFTCIGTLGRALNDDDVTYSNALATLEYFATVRPFTLGIRAGGAAHQGYTPFFDLYYLGQNTFLRGFQQNRFTGRSIAFANTDLRIHILDSPRSLIPFKFGIVLFGDAGRVIENPKPADDPGWHLGYGAGVYFVPLKERFTIQISAGFSDEESGLVRFGLGKSF